MSQTLKKVFAVSGILIVVFILAMIAIPFFFKDKIKDAVLETANKQLKAKVSINDFGLSLFKDFPNATLTLDNTIIIGINDFEKDTLLQAKTASITIDLYSLFGSNFNIQKFSLNDVSVYAKVLANGQTNWDIMQPDSTKIQQEAENETPFVLNLKEVSIKSGNITYEDLQSNQKLILKGWNGVLSGDFSADETTLKTTSTIDEFTFEMDKIPYLLKVKGLAEAIINANFESMKYTFVNSNIKLNDLTASIDGWLAMVGEDGMDFDLKLNAPDTQFKDILSVFPAMYTDNFKDVKATGTASIDAYIKGKMEGEKYPAFDVKILAKDAMFQYPALPKSVNNINFDMAIESQGGSLDNTVIDIRKFTFTMGNNPFSVLLNITTPMSDPDLKAYAKGMLDLGMIKEVYPLEAGTELNGKVTADINIATRMSAIEKEQYEKVLASGHLTINDMTYMTKDMPDVLLNKVGLEFNPRYVNLSAFDAKIGKNDLQATGRLENFIAYAIKSKPLKGSLNIKSNYLNANDFLGNNTSSSTDTTSSTDNFIIPKNIDFALNATIKEIKYDKINIEKLNGAMTVKDGILTLKNVDANALGGTCKISGSYDTSDPLQPKVDFSLNLNKVSFAETFKSVESIQKFAPIFENLLGTYSMNLNFKTSLGKSIMQTLAHLTGTGGLQTSDVKVENSPALNKLASTLSSTLKVDPLKNLSVKDLNIPFAINDGKMTTKPFNLNIGDGGLLKLEGTTGLDQSINYKGDVTLPKQLANNYVKNVGITIGGTFTNPKFGIDTKSLTENALNAAAEQFLGGSIDNKKHEVNTKLADQRAQKAQNLREDSKRASDHLVDEAEKQAKALEDAANGQIAKIAAKKAGDKLVSEAKKQGQKLIDQAETQAKQLENSAEDSTEPVK